MLIVEDHAINQQYLSGLLLNWGITYDLAKNGKEAVDLAAAKVYDVILMDIRMPVMDGYEATRLIRSQGESLNKTTPIVALTATSMTNEKEFAMGVGINTLLTKPFSPDQLNGAFKKIGIEESFLNQPRKPFRYNPLLDAHYLEELYEGDTDRAQTMFEIFVDRIEEELAKLEASFTAGNWRDFAGQAHKLRPNFSMVGLSELSEMMGFFEKMTDGPEVQEDLHRKMLELKEKFPYYYEIVSEEYRKLSSFLGFYL